MKETLSIYLAGTIQKEHEKPDDSYWSIEDLSELQAALKPIVVTLLNPAIRTDNLADQYSVFGRDMLQVFSSSVVFVDARERRGLGVGAEMMWAKFHRIPVVTLAPKGSHYHRSDASVLGVTISDWVHPFVQSLSDAIVETVADGARWIKQHLGDPSSRIKGIDHIQAAMRHYKAAHFPTDIPMQELVSKSATLLRAVSKIDH